MNKLLILLVGALMSTTVFATCESEGVNYIDQTSAIDRFRELERMDVTSERDPADPDEIETISSELEDILSETEALESTDWGPSRRRPYRTVLGSMTVAWC